MKVLNIVETIVDGPHLRTSIYFAGCIHHCDGCHNPETWNFNQGTDYTPLELFEEVEKFGNKYVTLSGGDPMCQPTSSMIAFLKLLQAEGYNVWCYTGYTFESIIKAAAAEEREGIGSTVHDVLQGINVLVDGPFIKELKSEDCKWRGSTNQRLIDVQESLKEHKVILYND